MPDEPVVGRHTKVAEPLRQAIDIDPPVGLPRFSIVIAEVHWRESRVLGKYAHTARSPEHHHQSGTT